MVLQAQKPSSHNSMLGRNQTTLAGAFTKRNSSQYRPEPSPQNDASPRPYKRRRLSGLDGAREDDGEEGLLTSKTRQSSPGAVRYRDADSSGLRQQRREVPDSDAESDDEAIETDELSGTQRTDIEQALPQVKTDREAIEEYETLRAAEAATDELHGRLGARKWVKGKSSIYVDAFNLALETVLEEESHLFDEAEMQVFADWRDLGYEAQYL